MSSLSVLLIISLCLGLLIALAVAASRHKKAATAEIRLIGASALVESELAPAGTILIRGELWPARSIDGTTMAPHTRVRVVELQGHVLVVERSV